MTKSKTMLNDSVYLDARDTLKSLAGWTEDRDFEEQESELAFLEQQTDHSASELATLHDEKGVEFWPEKAWRDVVEALPDALVVIDHQGTIRLVNAQTESVFGYKRDELVGRKIEKLIPDRFKIGHVANRDEYFAHPKSRPMGARLKLFGRRKDGSEFPVEISLSPLVTKQGIYATSVIRDITQRKRQEAKFETLVENIPAVTFIAPLDDTAPELYVSPEIERMLGFSQKEWLEDPVLWHRQLHAEDRERWNRQFGPTCASGKPFKEIYRFKSKHGKDVWVLGSASLVRDADGHPSFLQGVAFDITSIKEAEVERDRFQEMLQRSNAELERRVEARTKELERFAYVASHDLTEPLRTLKNYPVKLAKEYRGKITDKADEWIDRTLDGVKRLEQLILHLLDYSRVIPRDRIVEPTDSAMCAATACANLQAAIDESGGEVVRGELPNVLGKAAELVILFQNLIMNAIKFRERTRPLRVEVDCRLDDGAWLFWVRDNGIGIESRFFGTEGPDAHKLFSLGDDGRVATKPSQYPGKGYGLHICKKIVTGLDGKIWVESEFGVGSTFFFTLPTVPSSM